jgi:hypothetical protein
MAGAGSGPHGRWSLNRWPCLDFEDCMWSVLLMLRARQVSAVVNDRRHRAPVRNFFEMSSELLLRHYCRLQDCTLRRFLVATSMSTARASFGVVRQCLRKPIPPVSIGNSACARAWIHSTKRASLSSRYGVKDSTERPSVYNYFSPARRRFSVSTKHQHGHLTPPRPGEEHVPPRS